MANLTLIEAMAKTADLVYQKVKTLISQSGGGSITLNTKTETAIGTLDGKTIYRQVFTGKSAIYNSQLGNLTTFSRIIKLELYVSYPNGVGINLSNYVKAENGRIATGTDYPTNYSDPDLSWVCIIEYLK